MPENPAPRGPDAMDIYGLFDPRTGELRYVGKARDAQKRLKGHLSARRRTPLYDWIGALRALGLAPDMRVLETVAPHEWQAAERRLIARHRQTSRLLNVADGGDEPFCSKEVRSSNGRKVAASRNQRAWRIKLMMGRLLKEGRVSEQTRQKLRLAAAKAPDLFGEWASV